MKINFLKNKEIKNASWLIGEQVFQMLVSLIVGVLSARYLGPSNYGTLNYTASFVAFFTSLATLGMDSVVIKKMIAFPDREGECLGTCMLFRLISSCFSIFAISLVVYVLNPREPIKVLLAFLQSFQLSFRALRILDSWFQRYLKSKYISIGKMIACVIVSAYKIFLLVTAKSIVWFALSNVFSDAIVSVMLYIFYKREHGQCLSVKYDLGKSILGESYHFIISGVMTAIYGQMDKIMIGQMLTDADVGFYTTAVAICGMWVFVPTAIINSFGPKIMELKQHKEEKAYLRRLKQLYCAIIWLCFFVSLGITLLAKPVILILYGEAYLGAVTTLRIAIWSETFAMIGSARSIWILCENKNKYVKYYLFIGAVVNLVLNVFMIPTWGINGAAMATLITQFVTAIVAPLFFKETREHTKIVMEAFIFKWHKKEE